MGAADSKQPASAYGLNEHRAHVHAALAAPSVRSRCSTATTKSGASTTSTQEFRRPATLARRAAAPSRRRQAPRLHQPAGGSCSAARFVPRARELAANDEHGLVRVRAAEFLGLTEAASPVSHIMDALKNSTSGIEAGLMLNTVTLLRDGQPGYDFEITADLFSAELRKNDTVKRRLEYLTDQAVSGRR